MAKPPPPPSAPVASPAAAGTTVPLSAWIEIGVFLGAALALDLAVFGGTRFWTVSPHPFWVIVLLISVQYGTSAGLVAVAGSSAVLLSGTLPEQQLDQDYYRYLFNLASAPLAWSVCALMFGELRRRQMMENATLRRDNAEILVREDRLAAAYGRAVRMNEHMETRIASQLKTAFTIFTAGQAVGQLRLGAVLGGVEEMVEKVLSPGKFSLFILNKNTLEAVISNGWAEDDGYLTRIEADHPLYQALLVERRVLSVTNPQDEMVLGRQGILAGPIVHEHTGEVLAILKIEDMGFRDFHLSTVENFKITCAWVGSAFAKAEEYETSQFGGGYDAIRHIMPVESMEPIGEWLTGLAERGGFDLWQLTVAIADDENRDSRAVNKTVGERLMELLRPTDLLFGSHADYARIEALLPAATEDEVAGIVATLEDVFSRAPSPVTVEARLICQGMASAGETA